MISGEKIILRAIERSDIKQLWEWSQDEETVKLRNYPEPPKCLDQAEKDFEESLKKHDSRFLQLAILTREGELIGETSLRDIDLRAGDAEFAIAIGNKAYWGHGYGTDATRTMVRYAFEQLNLHRVTLHVHDFNTRAIRAYEKCGFREEGRLREAEYMDGKYSDVVIMGVLCREFQANERRIAEEERRRTPVAA